MTTSFKRRGLGYIKDRPKLAHEKQDFRADALQLPPAAPAATLFQYVIDVLDQGPLGACVANAIAQAIRCTHVREGITNPELLARRLLYLFGRAIEGTVLQDSGLQIRDAFGVLPNFGFCRERFWLYNISQFTNVPPPNVERLAFDQRAGAVYHRITETGEARYDMIRRALTAGYPVVFGCDVNGDFTDNNFDPNKPLAAPTSNIVGGHCMMFGGYSSLSEFDVLNSWSADWGLGGWCQFGLSYVDACSDLWIVVKAPYFSDRVTA